MRNFFIRFEPKLWEQYLEDTCYTYAINFFVGERRYIGDLALGKRVDVSLSDEQLLALLYTELEMVGLSPKAVSEETPLPSNRRRICIVRELNNKGYYHFYRQDDDGVWSHKIPGQTPRQRGRNGNLIRRVASEMEEGYRILSFISVDINIAFERHIK